MKGLVTRFFKSDLFKASFLNGIANLIKIITGLISNKVIAIYLGPMGVALLGQFQNFSAIILNLANFGINSGITKYTAEYKELKKNRNEIISTSFFIILIGALITSLIVFYGRNYFSEVILKSRSYNSIFLILSVSLIFFVLNSFFIAILNGYKEFKKIVIVNISSSIIGFIISVILVIKFGSYGALLSIILCQAIVFFVSYFVVKRFDWLNYKVLFFNFNIHIVKKLSNFSLMAVVSVLTVSLIQLQIRNYIIDYFTMQEAGYWQGVVRICDLYISFITTTLGVYFLPKLSELKSSKELNSEIKRGYLFILPVVIIASLFLYILRMKVILILYAPEFSPMERLFTFQIIGTVLKMASWLLAFLMLAKAMTKIYILTEIIFGLNYYFLTVIFINKYSLIGATYAYSLNYFLYLVTMIIIFRRILFYKMYLLKL